MVYNSKVLTDRVTITRGQYTSVLYITPDSGRIIYRDKIDTIIGIKHPGIILGKDFWGTVWVIHNHYQIGYPQIVTYEAFAEGSPVFYDNRRVFYNTLQIIDRAISYWLEKREYSWLYHNCQHFVNRVTRNENHSEAVDDISNGAMITGGILGLIGLATGNKALFTTGLAITGAGAFGKAANR